MRGLLQDAENRASVLNSCIQNFRFPRNYNFNKKVRTMLYAYSDTRSTGLLVCIGNIRYVRAQCIVIYPCVPALPGKQTWSEIWDLTQKLRFDSRIWIWPESSDFAGNFVFWDFSQKFQIFMTKFEIKILWLLVKPLQLKVFWPFEKPLQLKFCDRFQNRYISKVFKFRNNSC